MCGVNTSARALVLWHTPVDRSSASDPTNDQSIGSTCNHRLHDLHRKMDGENPVFAQGEAISSRRIEEASRQHIAADTDENTKESRIVRLDRSQRDDEIQICRCRIFNNKSWEIFSYASPQHLPLGRRSAQRGECRYSSALISRQLPICVCLRGSTGMLDAGASQRGLPHRARWVG